jgi:polygalacturonase
MTANFSSLSRRLGADLPDIVNVKTDHGAVGDGVTDDTSAIQAAIDDAYGGAASPNGTNSKLNKPLFCQHD